MYRLERNCNTSNSVIYEPKEEGRGAEGGWVKKLRKTEKLIWVEEKEREKKKNDVHRASALVTTCP